MRNVYFFMYFFHVKLQDYCRKFKNAISFMYFKNEAPKNAKMQISFFEFKIPPKQNAKLHVAFLSFKNLHVPMGSFSHLFHTFKCLTWEETVPDLTSRLDLQFSTRNIFCHRWNGWNSQLLAGTIFANTIIWNFSMSYQKAQFHGLYSKLSNFQTYCTIQDVFYITHHIMMFIQQTCMQCGSFFHWVEMLWDVVAPFQFI